MFTVITALLTTLPRSATPARRSSWRSWRSITRLVCCDARRERGAQAEASRPPVVGVALTRLRRLASCTDDRQGGDGPHLAPERLSVVLDAERAPRSGRKTHPFTGDQGSHPSNEPRESALGRPAHPRRAAQAG